MSFLHLKTQANGAMSAAHQIARIEMSNGIVVATVNSYATEEAMTREQPALNWQDTYTVPLSAISDVEGWLVSAVGPFAGGTLLVAATPIEAARTRKWVQIKQKRDALEAAGFPYLGKTLDSDAVSVQRMAIAVLAATQAQREGLVDHREVWTCADNTTLVLDIEGVLGMPTALAAHARELHLTSQALRQAIADATTTQEVEAIQWPVNPITPTQGAL